MDSGLTTFQEKLQLADKNCPYRVDLSGEFHGVLTHTSQLMDWCENYVGQRYHKWSYRGGGVFSFANEDDAVVFALLWGEKR